MSDIRLETLVIVERENVLAIELREVVKREGRAFLIFARSDGSEVQVEIDPAKLRAVPKGRIEAAFQYRGEVVKAPQQDIG
jgi:hypothetical protein